MKVFVQCPSLCRHHDLSPSSQARIARAPAVKVPIPFTTCDLPTSWQDLVSFRGIHGKVRCLTSQIHTKGRISGLAPMQHFLPSPQAPPTTTVTISTSILTTPHSSIITNITSSRKSCSLPVQSSMREWVIERR